MTSPIFILRGLRHYRSAYLGVLLGSALGAMVLLGALFAGDSVKSTLRHIAEQRTGRATLVLAGGESLFRASLAESLPDSTPILQLRGQVDRTDGRSTGQVNLFGIAPTFWSFAISNTPPPKLDHRTWAINRELARTLDLTVGEALTIRLGKPGLTSRDAPLSGEPEELITLRGTIGEIRADDAMGRFNLEASQLAAPAIFLPIERLAEAIERPDRANLLLFKSDLTSAEATAKIRQSARLPDYGLSLLDVPLSNSTEIRTNRIFLPDPIEKKLRNLLPGSSPVVTYLANTIAANGEETPYSMVTGVDAATVDFLPDGLATNEIALNSWEAEDLSAKPGDTVTLKYFTLASGNQLAEKSSIFTVKTIVPLAGAAADQLWMPDFPGMAEADKTSDWTPGLPLDLTRIRKKDETYWDDHRGTPKAFIPYATATRMWSNRWGGATSLRLKSGTIPVPDLEKQILSALTPADAGLLVRNLAAESRLAASSPVDIAGLFLSMSFFLILSAVALTAMLFRFNIEQRNHESGLLAALGIPAKKILHWRLIEGFVVVTLGSLVGTLLAFAYTRGLLRFLESIWNRGGDSLFRFHAAPTSIIVGLLGFIVLMMLTIRWVTRKQAKRAANLRLESGTEEIIQHRKSRALWILTASATIILTIAFYGSLLSAQIAFFLFGFSLLTSGLALFTLRSTGIAIFTLKLAVDASPEQHTPILTPDRLARLNIARRPTRSLVVVGSLASGLFLVVSVTAFQKHGGGDWRNRQSPTGGFALWVETTTPIHRTSSKSTAGDPLQLGDQRSQFGEILPFRIGTGDDASCFNLNSVTRPRLLATDTAALEKRRAFTIKSTAPGIARSWQSLREGESNIIRAFVDETTLLWVLKKQVGDRIDYTDEQGNTFPVEIAGTLAASVFQGSFVVDEQRFLGHFPSSSGHQLFLADASDDLTTFRKILQRSLTDLGATITTTADRIAAFNSVENTYISIFNILGGLGVILGSAGLGIVTARNLAERKNEFAQLHQLGIPRPIIRSIIVREIRSLILWAIGIGLTAAIISIFPALLTTGLITTLGSIAALALLFLLTATTCAWIALRTEATAFH